MAWYQIGPLLSFTAISKNNLKQYLNNQLGAIHSSCGGFPGFGTLTNVSSFYWIGVFPNLKLVLNNIVRKNNFFTKLSNTFCLGFFSSVSRICIIYSTGPYNCELIICYVSLKHMRNIFNTNILSFHYDFAPNSIVNWVKP